MRIKLIIEYDGTNYVGWQRQLNGLAVQQVVEEALEDLTGEKTVIHAAGRTDAGVHALGQVVHFDTNTTIPPDRLSFALNTRLPDDIRVVKSEQMDDDFHARFCAKAKTYVYTYYNAEHASAVYRNTSAHARGCLDIEAMKKAAEVLVGTHDFASFCASGSDVDTTVRTVFSIDVKPELPFIRIEVTGSGFLYNMVRIIAGTLLEAGQGRLKAGDVKAILEAKNRRKASPTAPAKGLVMKRIYYKKQEFIM